jgi:hypothetical protein
MSLSVKAISRKTVTAKFCATYEAIYDRMAWWDNWNAARGFPAGTGPPSLQQEWKRYILVALDLLVLRARASFEYYLEERKYVPYPPSSWLNYADPTTGAGSLPHMIRPSRAIG